MVTIIEYTDAYAADFMRLNIEWLDKYNLTESHDLQILNDPRGTILENGGHIFLAQSGDEKVGSAALINEGNGLYELAKMSVAPAFRGMGISKLLLEKCLQTAKDIHANTIILYSNSQLTTAISLYEKYGFKHVAVVDAPFVTADIKMQLSL